MSEYSQVRAFNVGVAQDISVEAALIYDDLVYAQRNFGDGWFFRSYEMLLKRFPFYSEQTLRRHIKKLEEGGWISTKIMKVNGKPTCHFQIGRFLSTKLAETMETTKLADSINTNNTKTTLSADAKSKELLVLVNEITGRQFRTLPARGVKKTLDAFTLDEIRNSLTALSHDPWHKPKLKELSIDYFIRSTTIDRFMNSTYVPGGADTYGYKNGKKVFTEDDDGNQYWGGELITPQNQDQVMKERDAQ
jgi:hypothetical protein